MESFYTVCVNRLRIYKRFPSIKKVGGKMIKRILSLLLAAFLLSTLFTVAFAESTITLSETEETVISSSVFEGNKGSNVFFANKSAYVTFNVTKAGLYQVLVKTSATNKENAIEVSAGDSSYSVSINNNSLKLYRAGTFEFKEGENTITIKANIGLQIESISIKSIDFDLSESETTYINANEFSATNQPAVYYDNQRTYGYVDETGIAKKGVVAFSSHASELTYNLKTAFSGFYEIRVLVQYPARFKTFVLQNSADNNATYRKGQSHLLLNKNDAGGATASVVFDNVFLKEGVNPIRFVAYDIDASLSGYMYVYNIAVEHKALMTEEGEEITINSESFRNYTEGAEGSTFPANSEAEALFSAHKSGKYQVLVKTPNTSITDAVSVTVGNVTKTGSLSANSYKLYRIGVFDLEEGVNTLKIKAIKDITIDAIIVKCIDFAVSFDKDIFIGSNEFIETSTPVAHYDNQRDYGYVRDDGLNGSGAVAFSGSSGNVVFSLEAPVASNCNIILNLKTPVRYKTYTLLNNTNYSYSSKKNTDITANPKDLNGVSGLITFSNIKLNKGKNTLNLSMSSALSGAETYQYIYGLKVEFIKTTNAYKNLYVSKMGNDANDGSVDAPFLTVSRAKEEVRKLNEDMTEDIVVNIAEGIYTLDETIEFSKHDSGKNGYNVIYKGENAILSGGNKIEGWQKYSDMLYCAPYNKTDYVRNLYINGYPANRAKSKYRYVFEENYNIEGSSYSVDGIKLKNVNFPEKLSNPEDIELVFMSEWLSDRIKVEDFFISDGYAVFEADRNMLNNGSRVRKGESFYIENAPELLDEPGEFYYDRNKQMIYYYPYENEDLADLEVYTENLEGLIKIDGESITNKVENITFDGLTFRYGAWNFINEMGMKASQSDSPVESFVNSKGEKGYFAQVDIKRANNIDITNCEFSCLGSSAIAMEEAVSNSSVTNTLIRDISGSGIKIGTPDHYAYKEGKDICRNIEISENVLRRTGSELMHHPAISVYYEKDIDIINNTILDTPYTGISAGWGWENSQSYAMSDVHINYNHIENVLINLGDGGFIYTLGACKDSTVIGNYMKKHNAARWGGGVYFDAGSSYLTMRDNVVLKAYPWLEIQEAQYKTHDISVKNTHSEESLYDANYGENISVDKPVYTSADSLSETALKIKANAGVSNNALVIKSELPSFRESRLDSVPMQIFRTVPKIGLKIQAEDFIEGGEGVGYHKSYDSIDKSIYRLTGVSLEKLGCGEENYAIGTCFSGEWMAYSVDIPESGEYNLDIRACQTWNTGDKEAKIYVDGVLLTDDVSIEKSSEFITNTIGKFNFEKGTHIIKIEFVESFYFDYFELYQEGEKIGDTIKPADFSDVSYESYDDALNLIGKINSPTVIFRNLSGKTLDKIESGNIYVKANLKDYYESGDEIRWTYALYKVENGTQKLKEVKSENVVSGTFDEIIKVPSDGGEYILKLFAWDNMSPICSGEIR